MRSTTSPTLVLLFIAAGAFQSGPAACAAETPAAKEVLDLSGVRGGLVVHLGCGDGKLTTALLASDAYLVHGLDADAAKVAAARQAIAEKGLYGKVSIDRCGGSRLPYIDNLVNLLVVEKAGAVPRDEMLRVLAPGGVLCVKQDDGWQKFVKPRPRNIDDWNQYLHDASNNAVASDEQVGPPRHLQWIVGPNWSRHHDHMASLSAMVSAAGRVFYIMDEGPREAILLPAQWSLIARDAFSGTLLWKRPIAEWNTHLWPLKSGPNQLPRRLVAVENRVYVTLGIDAPLVALDAATGATVRTYADTDYTDEVIESDGTLFVLAATEPNKWKDYRPKHTYVWSNTQRANTDWAWDAKPRRLVALRADTGKELWRQTTTAAPLTLAADAENVYTYDGATVVARRRSNGEERWTSEPVVRKSRYPTGYGPTLVVQQGVVLLSVENATMTALAADDGKTLWRAKHHRGGHASPDDMLVVNGLVWSAAVANGADSGQFTGRDLKTGEVKREFLPDVDPDWFHHRCYRSRASGNYFIASRTGIEFIDLEKQHWDINHWVRGGCLYGFMPSNGLLYAPPSSCGCFLESKLMGLNALAAASETRRVPRDVPEEGRLEKGPAYVAPLLNRMGSDDWPTYRHDAARSGAATTAIPSTLKRAWQTDLGGRLSAPTIADGKVYVAAIDRHTVYALDSETGRVAWSFTAGARLDSPPTIHEGRVIFGSADGWVYCLWARNGQLMWRYCAAPLDRRLMAYEQLESAWPVSGSVLVANGAVCCVAGRSAFLDGGMRLVRLDPATGRKLSETLIDDRLPGGDEGLQEQIKGQDMPVALPDILSSDGRSIYMRAQAFDMDGSPRETAPRKLGPFRRATTTTTDDGPSLEHLFSRSGFLDDSWFWRSYWILGSQVDGNYGGWLRPGHFAPCGRLMVFDDKQVYGFDRRPEYLCNASVQEYYVYGAGREVTSEALRRVQAATGRIDAASSNKSASSSDWATRKRFSLTEQNPAAFKWAKGQLPLQARGLVLAGETLFVAGPADVLDEEHALRNYDDAAVQAALAEQTAALRGRRGGKLVAFSAKDGGVTAAYEIGATPVFDGMAAAQERLFVSTLDGKVVCLGQTGDPLPPCDAAVESLDVTVSAKAEPEPKPEPKKTPAAAPKGPSKNKDFATVIQGDVTASELGYHLHATGKQLAIALREAPAADKRVIRLKTRVKVAADGNLENAFLVFGEKARDESLVKCGLRFRMKKAVIVEGLMKGGATTEAECAAASGETQTIEVVVDLDSGQVTMTVGKTVVKATLEKKPAAIRYAGVAALEAAIDFSPVEVSAADR